MSTYFMLDCLLFTAATIVVILLATLGARLYRDRNGR